MAYMECLGRREHVLKSLAVSVLVPATRSLLIQPSNPSHTQPQQQQRRPRPQNTKERHLKPLRPPRGRGPVHHTAAGEDHGLWKFVDRGTGRWEVRQGTGGDPLLHGAGAADAGIQNRCGTQRVKRGRWEDLWDQG